MNLKTIIAGLFVSASIIACKDSNSTDMQVEMAEAPTLNVTVVNAMDPVCEMEMPKFLKDTLTYDGELYGFCHESCKNTFKDSPEEYIAKLKE